VQGRQLRVDTTVVETNIHYPTDSALLGEGVRVIRVASRNFLTICLKQFLTFAGFLMPKAHILG
jgi:hypothetical protein